MAKPQVARSTKFKLPGPLPLTAPRTHCPITGEMIRFLEVGKTKDFMAVTSLWTSRIFQTREALVRALSFNGGTEPAYKKSEVSVVRDELEPPKTDDQPGD